MASKKEIKEEIDYLNKLVKILTEGMKHLEIRLDTMEPRVDTLQSESDKSKQFYGELNQKDIEQERKLDKIDKRCVSCLYDRETSIKNMKDRKLL